MRLTRLLVPLALAASLALPHTGAGAVQTLTFTFAVQCDDPNGTASNELADITLPSGTYAYSVAGVCTVGGLGHSTGTTTPCWPPFTGPIPCATVTAGNLPHALCNTSTGGTRTACDPLLGVTSAPGVQQWCGQYSLLIGDDCIVGQAGAFYHEGGVMAARVNDVNHADNVGALLVTVVFTPL